MLGPSYALRCVVFHNISDTESLFTKGMNVTITPKKFEAAMKFITRYYSPVHLQDVLTDSGGRGLPARPVLVTFDDAYASVVEWAAPLCRQLGVPAVFFVNAAFLDNRRLAPDNLVCYVANTKGMKTINAAIRVARGDQAELHALSEVFSDFFPRISLAERQVFLDALLHLAAIDERRMAEEANLYLTRKQLSELMSFDFEIGNHTYTHVHSRSLSQQDFVAQVDRNKSELESVSGNKVRSFSQPYGSSVDITDQLAAHLQDSGHQAVFLSESVANRRGADPFCFDRISARAETDNTFFFELEILPRFRAIRNCLAPRSGAALVSRNRFRTDRQSAAVAGNSSRTDRSEKRA
jgi:peptidoglycan/xylan/chitin deacetylase (PgdA/CDA1 family)